MSRLIFEGYLYTRRSEVAAIPSSYINTMQQPQPDRKSTRLNSSHANISYAVFCLKKKKSGNTRLQMEVLHQAGQIGQRDATQQLQCRRLDVQSVARHPAAEMPALAPVQ